MVNSKLVTMQEVDINVLKANNRKIANILEKGIDSILYEARSNPRSKVYINEQCDRIKITPTDSYESHYLILKLDEHLNPSVEDHSLPDNEKYFMVSGAIETYSGIFFRLLDEMEKFYDQMDTIDELTYVVDPVKISTKHNYRMIKLENRVYMKIKVDPLEPTSVTPTFYGPSKQVERYRQLYLRGVDDWNPSDDIYRNLLKIFDLISFPGKDQIDNNMGEYCSICYSYRMENQIPIVSCDNEKCSMIFHTICLKEWFATLRDTKTFLNLTSGRCPACKDKLSTVFNDLLDED